MTLRRQLERADKQLAELSNDEIDDATRFDVAQSIINRAHKLALEHHAADAAKIVENVTAPLSPKAGRRLLAAMIAALPVEVSDTLDPPQIARQLKVSPDTVLNWIRTKQLKAADIASGSRPRWIIQRTELERFLRLRSL